MESKSVKIGNLNFGNQLPINIISGPCQIESIEHSTMIAGEVKRICDELNLGYIFKGSFDKANRSSYESQRGVGLEKGLKALEAIKKEFSCPVLTDIHTEEQCVYASEIVDILQIPAFLCRQTDLILKAGHSGAAINIKKGQFLAPWDMTNIVDKVASTGNDRILLSERGTSFGYNTLVTDMRSLSIMANTGYPVVIDATHSVQQPGGMGKSSGGQREFVATIAKASVAVGVAAVFIETHENPDQAPSDGPNMVPIKELRPLLETLKEIDEVIKKRFSH